MPTYDYFCPENAQTIQIQHGMKDRLATWGELCAKANAELGSTPADAPVERIISGGLLTITGSSQSGDAPPMPSFGGGCCGRPDRCGH